MSMISSNVPELCVVRLMDGREGTVQFVHPSGYYVVEIEATEDIATVTMQDIDKVLWYPKQ